MMTAVFVSSFISFGRKINSIGWSYYLFGAWLTRNTRMSQIMDGKYVFHKR